MKLPLNRLVGAVLIASALGLSACANGDSYSTYSVGASSYDARGDGPRGDRDWDGIPDRFDRDRDGDGVPNRLDSRPNNPRWRE